MAVGVRVVLLVRVCVKVRVGVCVRVGVRVRVILAVTLAVAVRVGERSVASAVAVRRSASWVALAMMWAAVAVSALLRMVVA